MRGHLNVKINMEKFEKRILKIYILKCDSPFLSLYIQCDTREPDIFKINSTHLFFK